MNEITAAVTALKKQLGARVRIMGHHYQSDAVVAHCDITGDSLELARRVPDVDAEHIVFCGVFFNRRLCWPNRGRPCICPRLTPTA